MADDVAARRPAMVAATPIGHAGYWFSLVGIALCILVIDLNTHANDYADLDTYLVYLSQLVHFPPDNWYYFEALSNFYLLFIHWLTDSVDQAVVVAHYLLGVMFVGFLAYASPPGRSSWPSLVFMFALLGSLLAFVTLRATPAYFLVAIGVRYALDRDRKTWACLVIATLFHASALLAAAPLAFLYFRDSLPSLLRAERPIRLFVIAVALFAVIGILGSQISKVAVSLIESIPILSKYVTYTDQNSSPNQATSLNHYLFFAFVSVFAFFFFVFSNEKNRRLNEYVLISFVLYAVLFAGISPVAAVRQAPFWLMPMIGLYPWRRVGVTEATAPLFVLACAGLFYFQFEQVYL